MPALNSTVTLAKKGAARTLFLKIFLWFWIAVALSGMVIFFLTASAQIGPIARLHRENDMQRDRLLGNALFMYGEAAIEAYDRGGSGALLAFTEKLQNAYGVRVYLFENMDLALPEGEGHPPAPIAELAKKTFLADGSRIQSAEWGKGKKQKLLVCLPVTGPYKGDARKKHEYVIAGQWPYVPFQPSRPMPLFPLIFGFRQLIYLIVGGIICYALAWQLTAPVRRLRQATQRLASGDLKARVGEGSRSGGEEIEALGRDFDSMAERIEALLDAQQRLIRDISHELRSPLARLNVALELAKRSAGENAGGPLGRIEKESDRLNDLIAQLVTLTLLESGHERLEKTKIPVALVPLVMSIADDAGYEASGAGRRVSVLSMEEDAVVNGSPEMLRSAIENVVRNAVRYTPSGSEVEITLRRTAKDGRPGATIRVRDHGPGVPEAALAHLFKPFYRVADARERASGGTGVGLAITERAVHLHGGEVNASNAPDGGLVVEISLPLSGS